MKTVGPDGGGMVTSHGTYGSAPYQNNIYNLIYLKANADGGSLKEPGNAGDGCMDITFYNSTPGHDCANCGFDLEYHDLCE